MTVVRIAGAALTLALVCLCGTAPASADAACPATNTPNELVAVAGGSQTAQVGRQFQAPFQVQLANTNGCPLTGDLAGVSVQFAAPSSGPGGVFATTGGRLGIVGTDAQGVATAPAYTANDSAGSYLVIAWSAYGSATFWVTNTVEGVPASITAAGGDGQQAAVGAQYAQPLQARVTDANGNPVQGAVVGFTIVPGVTGAGAAFVGAGQATATTDANGVATSPLLLANGTAGRFTVAASVDGVTAVATYALANRAAPVTVAPARAAQTATVEGRYARPLEATVRDAAGNPVEGASVGFTIAPSAAGAGATFQGGGVQATAVTDADGRAVSPPLVAGKVAGSFAASATTAGAAQPARYTLRNRAGAPHTASAGAASGESTAVGTRFPVPLAVTVTDTDGNAVAGATVVFTAPRSGASARFAGHRGRVARLRTNASGIAVAPPLHANAKPGGYVVTARVAASSVRVAFALVNERS
jgi:Bacterial Ig-like domain (group 1)